MNFSFYLIFSILIFLTALIGCRKFHSTTLYTLAIGGVVNSNYFTSQNYPINCFNLPFGIDAIIYTLFIFCVIIMYFKEGKKSAYILSISSILAIIFSAFMELIAKLLSIGSSTLLWTTFLTFLFSAIASAVAIVVMLEFIDKIKDKVNKYITLILALIIASLINSFIYFGLSVLINGAAENFLTLLLTSYIGKFIAIVCGIFTFFLLNKIKNKGGNNEL